jgi:signal transduction histidine kinase
MIQIIQQALTILTTPPGNLTYHLIVTFLIVMVLQAAQVTWRARGLPEDRRMAIGLSLLLLTRVVLFLSALIAGQDLGIPAVLFPILDRTVTALSLAIIVWLWAFPQTMRLADAASLLIGLLAITLSVFTFVWWSNQDLDAFFNASFPDLVWQVFSLVLLLLGALMLFARRPIGWGVGVVMLAVLALGHALHLLAPLPGSDYPGLVRLFQLIAYPLLYFLPQRFIAAVSAPAVPTTQAAVAERRRYSLSPTAFESFLSLAAGSEPGQVCRAIVRTVSEALLADICLLIAPPDEDGNMAIECGYDLIREQYRDGGYLFIQQVSMLATALQRGRVLRLPANSSSDDLAGLSESLNISRAGSLLAVPLLNRAEETLLGLVLLTPYSNRTWTPEDQNYLVGVSRPLADIVLRSRQFGSLAEVSLEQDEEVLRPLEELESLKAGSATAGAELASQQAVRETIAELQVENRRLQQALDDARSGETSAAEVDQLQAELRLALEELAYLRNQLGEADEKLIAVQNAEPDALSSEGSSDASAVETRQAITSLAQELRQPMSSIIGYTDLLLSESAGILGALQRKFLERVKVSTERIGALVEDLIQVTALDSGSSALTPQPIDLYEVIQETVGQAGAQIQAKELDLRLDLPEILPHLHADRDAIQQALFHLLQNAVSATPEQGQVSLRAHFESSPDQPDYLLIQVADQGGGIPPEDLSRVFSRLYRADNVLIQGVGDTGVGLSIVKQLVEAHGGRVWVDTDLGHGSIFSLLLPVDETALPASPDVDGRGEPAA